MTIPWRKSSITSQGFHPSDRHSYPLLHRAHTPRHGQRRQARATAHRGPMLLRAALPEEA